MTRRPIRYVVRAAVGSLPWHARTVAHSFALTIVWSVYDETVGRVSFVVHQLLHLLLLASVLWWAWGVLWIERVDEDVDPT